MKNYVRESDANEEEYKEEERKKERKNVHTNELYWCPSLLLLCVALSIVLLRPSGHSLSNVCKCVTIKLAGNNQDQLEVAMIAYAKVCAAIAS